ncbi:hypothetical protein V1294_006966 [Bradyrhizobium sp. AZCC 1678]
MGGPHAAQDHPCLSSKTALAMVFKLVEGARKSWRRLDGHNQLRKIIERVKFMDGLEVAAKPTDSQPQTAAD